jgi:hypothetical protein
MDMTRSTLFLGMAMATTVLSLSAWYTIRPAPTSGTAAPLPSAEVLDELDATLRRDTAVRWVNVASILGDGVEACIDGRTEGPVLGTPGGDTGEIVLGLAALERTAGRELDLTRLGPLLDEYHASFGRLYLHTDEHALEALGHALHADVRFAEHEVPHQPEALGRWLLDPPEALRAPLLELLTEPEHVGCGHLRLMLTESRDYGVRPELVRAVLAGTFELAWRRRGALRYDVIAGEHREEAVLEIESANPIHAHSRVPMITPHEGAREFFVHHGDVASYLRKESGWFFVEHAREVLSSAPSAEAYLAVQERLGEEQLRQSLARLAHGLPVIHVRFEREELEVVRVRRE